MSLLFIFVYILVFDFFDYNHLFSSQLFVLFVVFVFVCAPEPVCMEVCFLNEI